MKRLFQLSMAFFGVVVVFIFALVLLIEALNERSAVAWIGRGAGSISDPNWVVVILDVPIFIIAGAGIITLGVMLAKHIMGLIKK